ncbi:MAG: hypothetical protein OEV55_04165 [candidate division Zixibacteria bacterium]|nr:hypothetical protein [candidate division Zixibacteria bacterium]
MQEKPQDNEKISEEKTTLKEEKPGKVKHERLKQEYVAEAQHKEKMRDFRKGLFKHGKHLFDRKRKDKFLGGTKGRRGG